MDSNGTTLDSNGTTLDAAFWSKLPARHLTIERLHLVVNDIQDVIDFLTNATFAFLHNLIIESPKSSRPPLREKAIALFNAMTEACSAETL